MFSAMVRCGTTCSSWGTSTTPAVSLAYGDENSADLPSGSTEPVYSPKGTTPLRILTSVDLPAPFSPTTASTCPSWRVISTSFRTVVLPYTLVNDRATSSAVARSSTEGREPATGGALSTGARPFRPEDLLARHPPGGCDLGDELTQIVLRHRRQRCVQDRDPGRRLRIGS